MGMQGLQKFAHRENIDPNSKIVKVTDPETGQQKMEYQQIGNNFEAQSIKTDMSYKWSAVGEMNNEELDQLNEKNQKRIKEIEQQYFDANSKILTAKQIMNMQKETFEIKERYKDSSINYPTYGRGLKLPQMQLNTFMISQTMCTDVKEERKKKEREAARSTSSSPREANVQAQQRKRILSPRRQRYESQFEKFLSNKFVDEKLQDKEPPSMDFDTTTKPEGTLNAKVNEKQKHIEREKRKATEDQMLKSLPTLEKDAIEILLDEVQVVMGKDILNKLKEVFDSCKERGKEDIDEVETPELIASIAEDEYFEKNLNLVVRESVDGVKESLESLLHRILKNYKGPNIEWHTFLGFFTKRGRLRESEKLNLQLNKGQKAKDEDDGLDDASDGGESNRSFETKKRALEKQFDKMTIKKQNAVPKTGKGKYNVTVPVPFEFMNQEQKVTIRAMKVEQMVKQKIKKEERELGVKYSAREVPKNVKENRYEKLQKSQELRRQENKRLAAAKIKATEAPFKFYERDVQTQRKKQEQAELPAKLDTAAPPFRAGKIPWRVLVPLYKSMVDEQENDRDKRIRKNAEVSLALSKLPPRMEAHEKKVAEQK